MLRREASDQSQGITNGQLIEIGNGKDCRGTSSFRHLQSIKERIGVKPFALAVGALPIGPISGEQDADMHLVGVAFEPLEIAFYAIPGMGPFLAVLTVSRFAVHDPPLVFWGQAIERNVQRNALALGHANHVGLTFRAHAGLPRADGTFVEGFAPVRDGQEWVDGDDATESFTGWAGTEGMIEGKEGRGRFPVIDVATGAMETTAKSLRWGQDARSHFPNGQVSATKGVGLLAGFDEARAIRVDQLDAVGDDDQLKRLGREEFRGVFDTNDLVANQQALKSLLA